MIKNTTENNYTINVTDLHKSYGNNKVLTGVNFKVKKGTMLALLGPNGAGKTTIVRILSTLLKPDQGNVQIEGFDLQTEADKVRSVIGLTGQSAAVDELLTGRENLYMMGRLYRLTSDSAKQRSQDLLEEFDLVEAADRPTKTYSGGMRRRLDLAVSLIATPPIIFLDEPTTGLDPRSRIVMWDIIRNLMKKGTTILLTTQYLEEADQLADNIILINNGKVAAEGTAKQLKNRVGNDQLVLGFYNQKDYAKSIELLGKQIIISNDVDFQVTIKLSNTYNDVRTTLDKLDEVKIKPISIEIHKPTLDDVFLNITETNKG